MASTQVESQDAQTAQRRRITQDAAGAGSAVADTYAVMARDATLRIAAGLISQATFPQVNQLPRLTALPFVNLGHIPLLEYDLLGRLLWKAALDLAAMHKGWKQRRRRESRIMFVIALVVAVAVVFLSGAGSNAALILALLSYWIGSGILRSRDVVDEQAAVYKRQLLSTLVAGDAPDLSGTPVPARSALAWGDGRLGPHASPLLLATAERRFPGFGREQGTETLVCPRDSEQRAGRAEPYAPARIYEAVLTAVAECGLPELTGGYVVVAEAASLGPRSPFLDDQLRPRLWISPEELGQVEGRGGSARIYFAAQVLLPERQTAATVFVRAFGAGDAAAVEISLSVLGPASFDSASLRERIRELGTHDRRSDFKRYWRRRFWRNVKRAFLRKGMSTPYALSLEKLTEARMRVVLESLAKSGAAAQKGLDTLDAEECAALEYESAAYRREMTRWPGDWPGLGNWREAYSLMLPRGEFEGAETRATIRALYEQVASKILDTLKEMGYDVSKYRDRDGRLNIRADVIDRLVVGEHVVVERSSSETKATRPRKKKGAPAPAASEAA